MKKNLLATVDLGSNSFRLLIAEIAADGGLQPIDRIKETVRLTGGLDEENYLSREVQLLALEVLSRFSERLLGFTVEQVRVVGTSALRVAVNANEFIAVANKTLGYNIEVISGMEEARLIYIGASHSLPFTKQPRLIIDIGGGSTEFIKGVGYDPQIMESVTMGCVSFSNKYFPSGDLTLTNFDNAILAARAKIQTMEHLFVSSDWSNVYGSSGTVRALFDICLQYNLAEHLTLDVLYKIKKMLLKLKNIKHINLISLKEDRRQVIAGGLSILIAIFEELAIEKMDVADWSLREGLIYDLLGRKTNEDLRISTVNRLKKFYKIEDAQSTRVGQTALFLYTQLHSLVTVDNNYNKLLQWACELYEIGLNISHSDYHKHGAYILANSDLSGFSKPEQMVLADLVRAHRGSLIKACESLAQRRNIKPRFYLMMLAFRFAVIVNRNRKDIPLNAIKAVKIIDKNYFEIEVGIAWLTANPLTLHSLNEEIEQWKKCNFIVKLKKV
ncbi:MAG: Ppx/GppA phosphatase family protein [Burkholderiales bacterium]|nr:Ppx/GppA phosphatase family protein [Burkholderiales bacterium]